MSYKKLIAIANKFANKTVVHNHNMYMDKTKHKNDFDDFKRKFRSLLNEMSGDHMTLRVKGFDRPYLKEFSNLYEVLLGLFKGLSEEDMQKSLQRIIGHMSDEKIKSAIEMLNSKIQHFLEENKVVDLSSSIGLTQAKINSLNNLKSIIEEGQHLLNKLFARK